MKTYEEMIECTKEFYNILGIDIKDNIELAVTSLTMPQYAKIYNDKNETPITNNGSLATVGDSVCEAFLMLREFNTNLTKEELTNKKCSLTNKQLNVVGRKLLRHHLFAENNDIKKGNKKDYATAFEAVIGFISIIDLHLVKNILDTYLVKQ